MSYKSLGSWIEQAAIKTQELVTQEYDRVGTPQPGSALNQLGLRDGLEIIRDYLHYGEYEVAFDHLLYIITELDLVLPADVYALIERAGKKMGYPSSAWKAHDREAEAELARQRAQFETQFGDANYPSDDTTLSKLVTAGRRIEAIKRLRSRTGWGLKECVDYVSRLSE